MNEPVESGKIRDDFRIRSALPTIEYLRSQNCPIVIAAHLGRPKGVDLTLSLRPVAMRIAELLKVKFVESSNTLPNYPLPHLVFLTGSITDDSLEKALARLNPKDLVVLENVRFYPGEQTNDPEFAKRLANLGEILVNEAFSDDHRAAASIVGVTKFIPSVAGLRLAEEVNSLNRILINPKKPFVVMMGGAKISDKEQTLDSLAMVADTLLLGGGLANIMFAAKGYELGHSRVETEALELAKRLLLNYKTKIVLPEDVVVAKSEVLKDTIRVCKPYELKVDEAIYDMGPKSILLFSQYLKKASTIVWNGPLGLAEIKPFDTATSALAKIVGAVSSGRAFGVVGGGETVEAVRKDHQESHIDLVSTGGGAMLEYLAGHKLPGIEAVSR